MGVAEDVEVFFPVGVVVGKHPTKYIFQFV